MAFDADMHGFQRKIATDRKEPPTLDNPGLSAMKLASVIQVSQRIHSNSRGGPMVCPHVPQACLFHV